MSSITDGQLDKVRKLLAKAEDEATTPAEAEALTAKAAELMAKYGIERAMLAEADPGSDRLDNRVITCDAPWAGERAQLLFELATAMRCEAIQIGKSAGAIRMHLFGYASDLDRVEVLYTSLLLQMTSALAAHEIPPYITSVRAYRRSWLRGYRRAVIGRVRAAERRAEEAATAETTATGRGGELVLADRRVVVRRQYEEAYPHRKTGRTSSYTGGGSRAGYAAGQRADIGGARINGGRKSIGGGR